MTTFKYLRNQLLTLASTSLPALLLAAALAGCGGPSQPEGTGASPAVTLPANAEARDSVQASLTAPAPDAASTRADSLAGRSSVTPR